MITVIIPVYNGGSTLERCINSILLQSYADIEIIIVNDGSSDNSRDICAAYSKKYDNISTIDSAHIGVSGARNIGLKIAKGEFIVFCDADDIYLPDAFINMLEAIKNTDVVIGDVIKRNAPIINDSVISADDAISRFFSSERNRILGTIYGKLFRKNLINQELTFDENLSVGEDAEFLLKYLFKCISVSLISSRVYRHFENPLGTICSLKKDSYESAIIASKKMIDYIINHQERRHLDEALQDLLNVFALILLRMRDVSWGTKIFGSVISIIGTIGAIVEINGINIYSHSKHCRKMSTIFNDDGNKNRTLCIQWPTSLILVPLQGNKNIQIENFGTSEYGKSFNCRYPKCKQYFITDSRDLLEDTKINKTTYLGVAHLNN